MSKPGPDHPSRRIGLLKAKAKEKRLDKRCWIGLWVVPKNRGLDPGLLGRMGHPLVE